MKDPNKYYVERSTRDSLKGEKVTDLNWESLINLIAKNGIFAVDKVRYHNIGQRCGTEQIEGQRMLQLWKDVKKKTNSN